MIHKYPLLSLIVITFVLTSCVAPRITYKVLEPQPITTINLDQARQEIDSLIKNSGFPQEDFSIKIISLKDQSIIYERNPTQLMVPASNTKLVTALAALDLLGPNFQYDTEVYYSTSNLQEGFLEGPIWIKGYGDPTLDVDALRQIVRNIKESGIKRFRGVLYLDTTFFNEYEFVNDNFLLAHAFNTGFGPLSVESNKIRISLVPHKDGRGGVVALESALAPVYEGIRIKKFDTHLGFETHYKPQFEVTWNNVEKLHEISYYEDTLNPTTDTLAVRRPSFFFGQLLRSIARHESWEITDIELGEAPPEAQKLTAYKSRPLFEIVRAMNYPSNNVIAEQLVLTVAAQTGGGKTLQEGVGAISNFLTQRLDFEPNSFVLENGSGLSRKNRLSAQQFVLLLAYAWNNPQISGPFSGSLPLAGWQGTLAKRLSTPNTILAVWAKTGHIDYVSCLSGYGTSANSQSFAFSFLANDVAGFNKTLAYSPLQREEKQEYDQTTKLAEVFRALQDGVLAILGKTTF